MRVPTRQCVCGLLRGRCAVVISIASVLVLLLLVLCSHESARQMHRPHLLYGSMLYTTYYYTKLYQVYTVAWV